MAKLEWLTFLRMCLADYRSKFPHDERDDRELAESLMEYWVKCGKVKKREDGKFVVPQLIDDITN